MSGTLQLICSESRIELGAINPEDASRERTFAKQIEPQVKQACQLQARVLEATQKVADAQRAANAAGYAANQHPTPENEKLRSAAQKNLVAANKELTAARTAYETVQNRLIQARNRFLAMTGSTQTRTPAAVRYAKPAAAPAPQAPAEGAQEASADRPAALRPRNEKRLNVRFQLSPQQRSGFRPAQR